MPGGSLASSLVRALDFLTHCAAQEETVPSKTQELVATGLDWAPCALGCREQPLGFPGLLGSLSISLPNLRRGSTLSWVWRWQSLPHIFQDGEGSRHF